MWLFQYVLDFHCRTLPSYFKKEKRPRVWLVNITKPGVLYIYPACFSLCSSKSVEFSIAREKLWEIFQTFKMQSHSVPCGMCPVQMLISPHCDEGIPSRLEGGGHGGRVVLLSLPTSEVRVWFPARPQVGKLVVACCWLAVYSTEP